MTRYAVESVHNAVKMCEQQLMVLKEDDYNKKRRRNKTLCLMSLMWNNDCYTASNCVSVGLPVHTSGGRRTALRNLCLLTTSLAFVFGLFVGVTIPLYLLPGTGSATPSEDGVAKILSVLCENASYSNNNKSKYAYKQKLKLIVENPNNMLQQFKDSSENDGEQLSGNGRSNAKSSILSLPGTEFPSVSFISQSSSSTIPIENSTVAVSEKVAGGYMNKEADRNKKTGLKQWKVSNDVGGVIHGGIYWGSQVEDAMPIGFKSSEAELWHRFARKTSVVKVEEGCGRMQNRLLTFEDGTRSCCRYRQNTDQIQGELFSFYLGQILGLRNLAPSSLALIRLRDRLWSQVRPQLTLAQWNEERAVVLTRFVPALEPAHIPVSLRTSSRRLHPPDVLFMVGAKVISELVELAQWSDLIIFDYLTANLDRVVNNLYNLQWNPAMMDAPAHNLAREPNSGLLVFFDNESGLLHGYRLLDKYEHYHGALLDSICVFRNSTVTVVKSLHREKNVGKLLQQRFEASEPEFRDFFPSLPEKSIKILNERIDRVFNQILRCELQYSDGKVDVN